jgi:hypothetical protein
MLTKALPSLKVKHFAHAMGFHSLWGGVLEFLYVTKVTSFTCTYHFWTCLDVHCCFILWLDRRLIMISSDHVLIL